MGGKSSPKAPDYTAAAVAQGEASREITEQQTWANRPDQYNPWGSVTWQNQPVYDPVTGQTMNRWMQETTVDPMLQWALENQMYLQGARSDLGGQLMDRAQQEYGQEMDWDQFGDWTGVNRPGEFLGAVDTSRMQGVNVPGMVQGPQQGQYRPEQIQRQIDQTPEEIRNRAEQAIYQRSTSRLDPQWQAQEQQLKDQMQAQGLRPGDEAYQAQLDQFNRAKTDAYQTAQTESIMGGGAEGQRQYEQMLGRGQFANQAAQQALAQQLGIGGQRFQEGLAGAGFQAQQRAQQFQQQQALREQQFREAAANRGMTNEQIDRAWQNQQNYATYQNTLRQNQIAEAMMQRGFSLNEINALLTGQQVSQPSFQPFSMAQRSETPQYLNAANMGYQADLQGASMQNAASGDMMSGLFGLGGTILGGPAGGAGASVASKLIFG